MTAAAHSSGYACRPDARDTSSGSALDVCDRSSVEAFRAAAESAFAPVDVMVSHTDFEAGAKTYTMIDEDDWDAVLDTNLGRTRGSVVVDGGHICASL